MDPASLPYSEILCDPSDPGCISFEDDLQIGSVRLVDEPHRTSEFSTHEVDSRFEYSILVQDKPLANFRTTVCRMPPFR